jgi:hypothetical protein
MKNKSTFTRRSFISTASALALGGTMMSFKNAPNLLPVPETDKKRLWDELTRQEKKLIEDSRMAKIIVEIEGRSCAERALLASLRFFGKPDELVCFAASFGGGIHHYDLCGLLTGGFMSIGLAADILYQDKKERSAFVTGATREYWEWWEERAPFHCYELKPKYSWDPENFNRMVQRIALKMENMLTPEV